MAKIKFGVGLFVTESAPRGVQLAQLADELGFDRFWVGDSHMIRREPYVLLGAIATATRNIEIGPGVTHPEVRHLTVTASAMATLNELTGGRAFLGIGVGATGPENIGMKPLTIEAFEEALESVRELMAGKSVPVNGRTVHCVFASGAGIPIYVGTRAPKVMKLAVILGDGLVYTGEVATIASLVRTIRRLCDENARAFSDVQVVYRIPCCIAANGSEAREEVKGKIARTAMTHLGRLYRRGELSDPEDRTAVEKLWEHYDTYHHMGPEHSFLVRDEWVDRFAVAGTVEEVREKVQALLGAGMTELTIIPFGPSKESVIRSFAEGVIAKL